MAHEAMKYCPAPALSNSGSEDSIEAPDSEDAAGQCVPPKTITDSLQNKSLDYGAGNLARHSLFRLFSGRSHIMGV